MTQEQKDILLKELCSRLPYGIKVEYENKVFDLDYVCPMYEEVKLDIYQAWTIGVSEVKPYLFPLSSMTEEQKNDLTKNLHSNVFVKDEISFWDLFAANMMSEWKKVFEWCHKNHFDICGLIPMGLAIDATGKNIY